MISRDIKYQIRTCRQIQRSSWVLVCHDLELWTGSSNCRSTQNTRPKHFTLASPYPRKLTTPADPSCATTGASTLCHHSPKPESIQRPAALMASFSYAELGNYRGNHSCGYCGGHDARSFGFVTQGMRVETYEALLNRGWRRYVAPLVTCL